MDLDGVTLDEEDAAMADLVESIYQDKANYLLAGGGEPGMPDSPPDSTNTDQVQLLMHNPKCEKKFNIHVLFRSDPHVSGHLLRLFAAAQQQPAAPAGAAAAAAYDATAAGTAAAAPTDLSRPELHRLLGAHEHHRGWNRRL